MSSNAIEKLSFHMSPEEFRKQGHAVVDWIADYYSRIESFPVLSQVQPGEIRAALPQAASQSGESIENILQDFELKETLLKGINIGILSTFQR